jgi:aldose 1-epimerase
VTVQIADGDLTAVIRTSYGNNAGSLRVGDREILWTPDEPGALGGIPLLAPWANRIDGDAYFANGSRFLLNEELGNLRRDAHHFPIHGLLAFVEGWEVVGRGANWVTSRLEFWRFPRWMAQFPFAHTIEITHRLREGSLEVETAVESHSKEPMPLSLGFHPYFQLTDSRRDEWSVRIPARRQVVLSEKLTPTGERLPMSLPDPFPLSGNGLDHVFDSLTGEAFVLEGPRQRISVRFGPKFPVAIVYAPAGRPFVCFEPMTALTNAFNLEHAGIASGLQHVGSGEIWRESFWVTPHLD